MKINEIINEGKDSDPCWDNYKQVGMKKKNGKKVPNCVPKESVSEDTLNELFSPGKDWKWSFKGSEEAVAVFHVGEIPYQFYAYRPDENYPGWDIEFKNAQRGKDRITKFGLTGTGNSAEVMSTVVDIMRSFLKEYNGKIKKLTFSAEEPSRQALYARMAKRLLPKWDLVQLGKNFSLRSPVEHGVAEGSTGNDDITRLKSGEKTSDGIGMQDIRLMAGEGKLTKRTVLQALAVIRKQRSERGVAEGAPIVVMPRSDRFGTKKPAQPYRNQGDIVPPTKPPSTEKRGVKGRPGQRPMPKYDESILEETYHDDDEFFEAYGVMEYNDEMINESEYQGRKVTLNKPFRTSGGPKKFSVYVKNEKGNVVKVNFGDPKSKIKKHIPGRRANFRARHNCDSPGPKTSARYWSCRNW